MNLAAAALFNYRTVYEEFMVDKVALGTVSRVRQFFPCQNHYITAPCASFITDTT